MRNILLAFLLSVQESDRPLRDLIEDLRSDRVERREAAARELQRRGRAALPELETAARDADAEVAGRARKVIRAIGIAERLTPALQAMKPAAHSRLLNGDDSAWTTLLLEVLGERRGPDLPDGIRRQDVEPLVEPALRGAPKNEGEGIGGGPAVALINALSRYGLWSAAPELARMLGSEDNTSLFSVIDAALVSFDATETIPQVAAHLGHRDEQVRRNAAELLGRLGDPSAVPTLRDALGDRDARVRKEAAIALGALRDPGIVPELRTLLKDDDFLTRAGALDRLGERADPADAPYVLPILREKDSFLRERAARILGRIGAGSAEGDLRARLRDEDHKVRHAAAWALGELGDRDAVPGLIDLLKDDLVAASVAQALGRIGDPRAIPGLEAILRKPRNPESARAAAEALCDLGAKEGVPELLKLTLEADYGAAWSAMDALVERRAREVVPDLLEFVRSKAEPTRRAQAVHLLGRLRAREAAPLLRDLFEEARLRAAAVEACGRIGTGAPELLAVLKDPQQGIRDRATSALIQTGDRTIVPELLKLLTGPDPILRQEAAGILGAFRAREAAEGLRALLREPKPPRRAVAVHALAALGERDAAGHLPGLLGSDDYFVSWHAARAAVLLRTGEAPLAGLLQRDESWAREIGAEALGQLGARHRIPSIRNLLRDPSSEVRIAAIRALDALEAYEAAPSVRKRLGSHSEAMALFPSSEERRAAAIFLCHAGSREGTGIVRDHFPSLFTLHSLRDPEAFQRWRRMRLAEPREGTVADVLRSLAKDVAVQIELPSDSEWLSERRRVEAGSSAAEALAQVLEQTYGAILEGEVVRIVPRPAVRAFWRRFTPGR